MPDLNFGLPEKHAVPTGGSVNKALEKFTYYSETSGSKERLYV